MKLKLVKKTDEALGTKSFFWETEKEVKWIPGQYYYYTIPSLKYPDPRGTTRHFTIASSPTEGNILRLTTKIREESGYKKSMDELPLGSVIEGEGPNGTFILDEKETGPQVFIAGGIGITPFRSMIKFIADKNLSTPIFLIYSNSTPEEVAFGKELEGFSASVPNFKLAITISRPDEGKEKWTGLTGRVDENLLRSQFETWNLDFKTPTFWVCGPPPMIDAMEIVLGKTGITSDRVRSEKFTGY